MKKINNKKWIIGGVVVAVAIGAWYFLGKKDSEAIIYRDIPVAKGQIISTILATGNVEPKNRLEIKAPVAGRIEEILVSEGEDLKKGKIIAWMSSSERAAMLDAARAKGDSEFKKWSELFLATPVIAPIDGKLIKKNVEPGQSFTTSDAIFVMSDKLTVKAQVDETDIAKIRLKGAATLQLDAYPDDVLVAEVDQIAFDSTLVNNVTTYFVDVIPKEVPDFMRSGMTANVSFEMKRKDDAVLVPADAVTTEGRRSSVRVKDNNEKSGRIVEVKLGISDGKKYEVISGLVGDEILLVPEFKLPAGQKGGGNPFAPQRPARGGR